MHHISQGVFGSLSYNGVAGSFWGLLEAEGLSYNMMSNYSLPPIVSDIEDSALET